MERPTALIRIVNPWFDWRPSSPPVRALVTTALESEPDDERTLARAMKAQLMLSTIYGTLRALSMPAVGIASHFVFGSVLAYAYTTINTPVQRPDQASDAFAGLIAFLRGYMGSNTYDSDVGCAKKEWVPTGDFGFQWAGSRLKHALSVYALSPSIHREICPVQIFLPATL
jgi:hypothetical protein